MEKLTIVGNFTKTIELLRNVECSQKEKINYFHQISDYILSPAMVSQVNYSRHCSNAIGILLLFCEDLDSVVRMNAEENLNRIIRSMENNRVSRILLDLFNEIKKNGNQKSLRICLNLFAYYCPRVKEKNVKWYALKLLPCLQSIASRKETLLLETLVEFMKSFGKNLQICLNDNETFTLMEVFLSNITSDCTVKRRCSSQNCITLIENCKNKSQMANYSVKKSIEFLMNDHQQTSTLLGVLGFFRLLLPIIIFENIADVRQIIEIYDFCLYLLNNQNHSIINASLEVINSILMRLPGNEKLEELLTSGNDQLSHNEFLKRRKSLKNQIFQLRKNSCDVEMTCIALNNEQPICSKKIEQINNKHDEKLETNNDLTDALNEGLNKQHQTLETNIEIITKKCGFYVDDDDDGLVDCSENNNKTYTDMIKNTNMEIISQPKESYKSKIYIPMDIAEEILKESGERALSEDKENSDGFTTLSELNESNDDEADDSHLRIIEDKSQLLSDIDNESFNSIDFESEITIDGEHLQEQKQEGPSKNKGKSLDGTGGSDWKLQKSTESIGSFFNNLLSSSHTESMTKLFRPTTKSSSPSTTYIQQTSVGTTDESFPLDFSTSSLKKEQQQLSTNNHGASITTASVTPTNIITPKIERKTLLTLEDDTISLESINSHISMGSHVSYQSSGTQDFLLKNEQDLVMIQEQQQLQQDIYKDENSKITKIQTGQQQQQHQEEYYKNEKEFAQSKILLDNTDVDGCDKLENFKHMTEISTNEQDKSISRKQNPFICGNIFGPKLEIGTIYDQAIIYYTIRLISSKFLLTGQPNINVEDENISLISDTIVRVSIKNLSLMVVGNCIKLMPEILELQMEIDPVELEKIRQINNDDENSQPDTSGSSNSSQDLATPNERQLTETKDHPFANDNNFELVIKDDHFGENTTSEILLNYPLSQSVDSTLVSKSKPTSTNSTESKGAKPKSKIYLSNTIKDQPLSKSEIIETKTNLNMMPKTFSILPSSSSKKQSSKDSKKLNKIAKNVKAEPAQSKNNKVFISGSCADDVIDLNRITNENKTTVDFLDFPNTKKQFIYDILLFYNHSDPILRGNIQVIIGHFIYSSLSMSGESIHGGNITRLRKNESDDSDDCGSEILNINRLLAILIKGFRDEIHTVVIHALTSFDKIFPLVMMKHFKNLHKMKLPSAEILYKDYDCDDTYIERILKRKKDKKNGKSLQNQQISPKFLLNELRLCYHNKYWLVQNKYTEVISNFDFGGIREFYGDDVASTYQRIFLDEHVQLLGDDDFRVREHSAEYLCWFIEKHSRCHEGIPKVNSHHDYQTRQEYQQQQKLHLTNFNLVREFFNYRIFQSMAAPLGNLLDEKCLPSNQTEKVLSKVLYILTNKLMELNDKNIQIGVVSAVKFLLNQFNPVDFRDAWEEFNFSNICLQFAYENYPLAIDLNCQNDLIEITTKLLAANALNGKTNNQLNEILFEHIMKILNIYYHLLSNQKPILFARAQRGDLFPNAKELAVINNCGYFGNDYFYIKLYNILKGALDSYKIAINLESGKKLMSLLKTCLNALAACLEMKEHSTSNTSLKSSTSIIGTPAKRQNNPTIAVEIKLIEEILQYLTILINYETVESIGCLRQLLKFLFGRNYANRRNEYEKFTKCYFKARKKLSANHTKNIQEDISIISNEEEIISKEKQDLDHKQCMDRKRMDILEQNANDRFNQEAETNLLDLFSSSMNFPLGKSKSEEDCAKHIKLFEPLVIFCLSLFMKSNANNQGSILDLLSQLLEFNVTYSILDSKNVIYEQIVKNLELIESGIARNSTTIISSMIRFLVNLTKQNDRKLITIPKIISTTNGLLANNSIRQCSILALKGLAFELFFNEIPKRAVGGESGIENSGSIRNSSHLINNIKELNTQKEVVLDMLEKFIDYPECTKMLIILMVWENVCSGQQQNILSDDITKIDNKIMEILPSSPTYSSIQNGVIFSIVIKDIVEGKIKVNNWNEYYVLDSLFKGSGKNFLLDSKGYLSLLSFFITKSVKNFNDLSLATIILDNVILKTEEIYLVNHIKLHLKNHESEFQRDKQQQQQQYQKKLTTTNEINYFAKVLFEKLDECFLTLQQPSVNFSYNHYNQYEQQHQEPEKNNNFLKLVAKFVRSLYDHVSKKDALNSVFLLALKENEFWTKYNLECLSYDKLKVEIYRILCLMSSNYNNLDKISILQKLKNVDQMIIKRTLIREIIMKFNEPNLWSFPEVQIFFKEFLSILLADSRDFLLSFCEISQYRTLFAENLIEFSNSASKYEIYIILNFINNARSLPLEAKVEIILRNCTKVRNNKMILKLIGKAIQDEKESYGKSIIESSLSKKNIQLNRLLYGDREELFFENEDNELAITTTANQSTIIDEKWLIEQIIKYSSLPNRDEYVRILLDIKSEAKLKQIFYSNDFNVKNILKSSIKISFETMMNNFQNDCIQFNAHINYMNLSALARVSLHVLKETLDNIKTINSETSADLLYLPSCIIVLLESIEKLHGISLIYVESRFIEKFIKDQILKSETLIDSLINFILISSNYIKSILYSNDYQNIVGINSNVLNYDNSKTIEIYTYCKCIDLLLRENLIWFELNQTEKYDTELNIILEFIHTGLIKSIRNTIFYKKYKMQTVLNNPKNPTDSCAFLDGTIDEIVETSEISTLELNNVTKIAENETVELYRKKKRKNIMEKVIFIAKVIESNCNENAEHSCGGSIFKTLKSIGISLLRLNKFYAYAVTPFEITQSDEYENNHIQGNNNNTGRLPSIPVEQLSDVDILLEFVKRLSIFGFTSRQQFEEYFMTFLLLINTDYDENMVDIQEQFQIKSACFKAILELLITYKTFPIVGNKLSHFHHTPRWTKIKCDNISGKKLHKVELLVPGSNVFYLSNLERSLSIPTTRFKDEDKLKFDNIIGTNYFLPNQYDLNFVWNLMENSTTESDIKEDVYLRNFRYFREMSEIDFKSSSQLIFDVITQLIEFNHVLVLPNLVKFCEICENRDQVKWIKQKVLKLQETIPIDDTISHQHIIYLLCKTQSMLIPSASDLSHLCSLISNYLKSSHVFIRNAALHGLLCLLECCSKTNTTIGKLSDELSMLRDLIIGYIIRHGIIEESSVMFSDLHTKLVWTLNFSLIEMTMKFVPDCNLLSNTIISANNLLKRTSNESVYLSVLHGLERIIIINIAPPAIQNKIEKLALELVKIDNEKMSIPALKLLLSCIYMGSSKQLENTELSNGIVQDDPEIIIQQTDKVDVLLHCIKSSKKSAAQIYGKVLCQIVRDLVPPKEILTKVIKEFLAINQPHCEVIAWIVHQVFRSAIDSSFLQMLQEWLICSLPTFLNLPDEKSVWSLTVIFISASINLHLIKLFPVTISAYEPLQNNKLGQCEISLFVTAAKDFHSKLSQDQKLRFREVFMQQNQKQNHQQQQQQSTRQHQRQIENSMQNKVFQFMLESL